MGIQDKKESIEHKNNKDKSKISSSKKGNKKYNNDLLMLLNEADKITLNDLQFDNILKEQSQILCNINDILNEEKGIKSDKSVCNIFDMKKDSKFKEILAAMNNKKYNKIINTKNIHIVKQTKRRRIINDRNKLQIKYSKKRKL